MQKDKKIMPEALLQQTYKNFSKNIIPQNTFKKPIMALFKMGFMCIINSFIITLSFVPYGSIKGREIFLFVGFKGDKNVC